MGGEKFHVETLLGVIPRVDHRGGAAGNWWLVTCEAQLVTIDWSDDERSSKSGLRRNGIRKNLLRAALRS